MAYGEGVEARAVRARLHVVGDDLDQARETVWWYFCGARSYAAMCWIQVQILRVASGMP